MKSLVVLPNWVGDTVLALPVVDALAAADRHLAVLGRPHLGPLLQSQSSIDSFVPRSESDGATIDRIRQAGFEEAVVLPNSIRSAKLTRQAAIPSRFGYGGRSAEGLVRRVLLNPAVADRRERHRHQVEDYADLLAAMEVPAPSAWLPQLELTPAQLRVGQELLGRANLDPDRPLIGLFAGAEFGPSKRWPLKRFVELAQALRRQIPGCQLAILAGP